MKHLLIEKQLSHYREKGFIEFEDFLTQEEIALIENEVMGTFSKKRGSVPNPAPEQTYVIGKDLYLENEKIKSFCVKKKLTDLAKALCNETLLRVAFDQAFLFDKAYTPPFPYETSLESIFSYQGLMCLVVIQLKNTKVNADEDALLEASLSPLKKGNVLYINPKSVLDIKPLFEEDTKLYMIGYTKVKSQYIANKLDPLSHVLKKRGFTFGDFLTEEFHPTC